jgi:hypothetical protein
MSIPTIEAAREERAGSDTAPNSSETRIVGVLTANLVGLLDSGRTALVTFSGQRGTAAVRARTVVDLHGAHVGGEVVLMFECGDPERPIVMGRVRGSDDAAKAPAKNPVDVEVDGERMIVSAHEQLVLQCGKASITLTRAGKVLISGSYVLTHSTGVNRIRGGSVQLN